MTATLADVKSALELVASRIEESNRLAKVSNVLALGQQMNLDMTKPQDVAKAARHLTVVEHSAGTEADD